MRRCETEPIHLITLSALASMSGGIVTPICFAVLRLTTSSNLVGCSMGQLSGLCAFQEFVDLAGSAPVTVHEFRPVVHEPATPTAALL
jgi:hypothetical protein